MEFWALLWVFEHKSSSYCNPMELIASKIAIHRKSFETQRVWKGVSITKVNRNFMRGTKRIKCLMVKHFENARSMRKKEVSKRVNEKETIKYRYQRNVTTFHLWNNVPFGKRWSNKCFEHLFQFSSIDVVLCFSVVLLYFTSHNFFFFATTYEDLQWKQTVMRKPSNGKSSAIYFYQGLAVYFFLLSLLFFCFVLFLQVVRL